MSDSRHMPQHKTDARILLDMSDLLDRKILKSRASLRAAQEKGKKSQTLDALQDAITALENAEDIWDDLAHQRSWIPQDVHVSVIKPYTDKVFSRMYHSESIGEREGYAMALKCLKKALI